MSWLCDPSWCTLWSNKNVHLFIFWTTVSKINRFLIIFGVQNPEEIWHSDFGFVTTLKNVTALPCEIQNSFAWSKLYCFHKKVNGFESSWLLCYVVSWISDKQHHKVWQSTGFRSGLLAGHVRINEWLFHSTKKLDCVVWVICIVLLEDKHVFSNFVDHWQQFLHQKPLLHVPNHFVNCRGAMVNTFSLVKK